MPVNIQDLIDRSKAASLQGQITGQQAKVQALGGTVKTAGPSILSRIFDTISRPLYGVSEGIARASEHQNPLEIGKGIVGGLAGKNKTDITDALLRSANANPNSILANPIKQNRFNLRTIAGLAGDVVADPLTYIAPEFIPGIGAAEATAKGGASLAEHLASPESIKAIAEARKGAKVAQLASDAAKGVETIPAKLGAVGQAAAYAKQMELGKGVAEAGTAAAKAAQPGSVGLKFAGKQIAKSEGLYSAGSKVGQVVGATGPGKWLNEAFRPAATFPEGINVFKRRAESGAITKTAEDIRNISKPIFEGLTPEEKAHIFHAIEAGPTVPAGVAQTAGVIGKPSSLHGVTSSIGTDLGSHVDALKAVLADYGGKEAAAGVFKDVVKGGKVVKKADQHLLENYMPHYYQGGTKAEQEAFASSRRLAVGPDTPGFTKPRTLKTALDAEAAGLKPVTDSEVALNKRIAQHHSAMARNAMVKDTADKFGTVLEGAAGKNLAAEHGLRNPNIDSVHVPKNMYFPEKAAKSLETIDKMYSSNEFYNKFLNTFDKANSHYRFIATAANPGHHVKASMGSIFNNFALGGVDNPKWYERAGKIMGSSTPEKYSMKVGEVQRNGQELLRHAIDSGSAVDYTRQMGSEAAQGGRTIPFLSAAKTHIMDMSSTREQYFRFSHFLKQFEEEGKGIKAGSATLEQDLKDAANRAGDKVRHVNLDHGDVTPFEQNVMKRIVPFYSWSRKNIPLQMEALALHPNRISAIPKGTKAIQTMLGTDVPGHPGNPLDTLPKWMTQLSGVSLQHADAGKNAINWTPPLPFDEISKYAEGGQGGILRSLVSQLTPPIRMPIEQATGKQLFSGAPVGSNTQYATGQLPAARTLYNLLIGKQKIASPQTLNYLTSSGINEVTPGQVSSELRRQQYPLKATIRSIRQKALQKAYGG